MKAPDLYKRLALFNLLSNKRALTASYRALVLSPATPPDIPAQIRGCAGFGAMRYNAELGIDDEVYVDAYSFLEVMRSLPDAEFSARVNGNTLRWECGTAKGSLTLISQLAVAEPEYSGEIAYESDDLPYALSAKFGTGLELSGLACGNMSVRSMDLEGIQIKNAGDGVYAYASDSFIMSSCRLGPVITMLDGQTVTLKPEAAQLLAALAKLEGNGAFGCDDRSFYCITQDFELQINQIPPLRHDLAAELAPFAAHNHTVPLMPDAITSFLRRAEALADINQRAEVEICVAGNRTSLRFSDVAGSTEEYYIAEGEGPKVAIPPMHLEAGLLAKALSYADRIVFDYAEQGVLALRGKEEFTFVISGYMGGLPQTQEG